MSEHQRHPSLKDIKTSFNHFMTGLTLLASGVALVGCIRPEPPQQQVGDKLVPPGIIRNGERFFLANSQSAVTTHDGVTSTLTFEGKNPDNQCLFKFESGSQQESKVVNPDNLTVFTQDDLQLVTSCDTDFHQGSASVDPIHPTTP